MNLQADLLDKISQYNIKVVDIHDPVTNPTEFMNYVKDLKGVEGFVIAWESGYRVKIKAAEYLLFHKTKDSITLEKNIIDMLVNETIDDTKPYMQPEDRERVEEFERKFWEGFTQVEHRLLADLELAQRITNGGRKTFAVDIAPNIEPVARSLFFAVWDGKRNLAQEMLAVIRKSTGTQTRIDAVRHLWGGARWSYNWSGEE